MIKSELFQKQSCILGEGMWYDGRENRIVWIDIWGCKVFTRDLASGEFKQYDLPEPIATIVPREDDGYVVGMKSGFYFANNDFSELTPMKMPEDYSFDTNRCNDGKCGPDGLFWIGVMEANGKPGLGYEYVVGNDVCYREISDLDIPNGIVWNKAHDKMYFTDTLNAQIYEFDYVPGHVSNKHTVYTVDCGIPDGMEIDEDDNLWIAVFGGFKVLKVDPRKGELLDYIEVEVPNITSVAIGGGKAYITTATDGLDEEGKKKYPNSGSVYVADVPQKGIDSFRYKG